MDAINKYSKLELPVAPTLWLNSTALKSARRSRRRWYENHPDHAARTSPGRPDPEDRQKLWRARHDVVYADRAMRPGGQIFDDRCMRADFGLAECIVATEKDVAASFLPAPIVGHAGDGNFHLALWSIRTSPWRWRSGTLNERLVHLALSLDGTCTGEHDIGCGKIDFLVAEHGEAVSVMRAIKKAIDPDNIMNPGKILRI